MSTPLIVMAANQAASREAPKAIPGSEQPKPPEETKKRGRKSQRGSNNKKPQRGMGVAQLERLRLEDRLKKLSEPQNQTDPLHRHGHRHQYHSQMVQTTATTLSVSADPLACVPVHYGGGQVIVSSCGSGLFSVDRGGLVVQRIGGSVTGFGRGAPAGVTIAGGGMAVEDPNPYGIIGTPHQGTPHQGVQVGAVYETSSELSSMPKMQSVPSDRCDTCCKKKRFNGGSVGVHGSYKDKCSTMFPISSGTGCLALKAETIAAFAGNQTLGFATAGAPTTGYVGRRNLDDQGVEVAAIHRKGNTSARFGGSALVEYEFFPCGNKQDPHRRGSYFKDMEVLPTEASVAVLGGAGSSGSSSEASHINSAPATTTYGADASNPVDLSLKLSY